MENHLPFLNLDKLKIENRRDHADFMSVEAAYTFSNESVHKFCLRHLSAGQEVRPNTFSALKFFIF